MLSTYEMSSSANRLERLNESCRFFTLMRELWRYDRILFSLLLGLPIGCAVAAWIQNPSSAAPFTSSIPLVRNHDSLPQTIPLTGSWQFVVDPLAQPLPLAPYPIQVPPSDGAKWQAIAVPSNWYAAGHDLSGVVWYRHQFPGNPHLQNKTLQLVFDGVDYAADVWLNKHYLGFHEGYFQPFRFDVSKSLYTDRQNELLVRVNSPKEIETADWSLHKRLIKGVLGHHDARPGGAWTAAAQDYNTGGIWAPVYLKVSDAAVIEQVKVTPHLDVGHAPAVAEVALTLNFTGPTASSVDLEMQLSPENFPGVPDAPQYRTVQLRPGLNRLTLSVVTDHPKRWETWDHGVPNLYGLTVKARWGDRLLDQTKTTFGFRTITFDPQEKVWKLNGRRLFIRGTNYIASQWLSEMTPEKYQADLSLMKKANINAVRVHAHVTGQAFYDLSDRVGLLVWQDFPLQWGYTEDPRFAKEAIKQAKDMVNLLYNHPSIMAWSLHNEPPWNATWMKYKYKSYSPKQNRQLDRQLYSSLGTFDPTRHVHPYSGVEEHPWWGWYSFTYQKYAEPTKESIISEFGAQALPDLRSLRRIFSESELWPDTETKWKKWEFHNFQQHETFKLAKVPMGNNSAEFVNNTQLYQADVNQFAAEAYRRQRYQPVAAIFQFMFSECWPSINWGMVDYWRNPKLGYTALQKAYQPILPMVVNPQPTVTVGKPIPFDLWVVNDLWQSFPKATLTYTFLKDYRVVKDGKIPITLKPDSGAPVRPITLLPVPAGRYELQLKVVDARGAFLSQNAYRFEVIASGRVGSDGGNGHSKL
jgi:beta-mannosidase